MNKTKITKKEFYNAIIEAMTSGEVSIEPEKIIDFCNKEIAALDRKAEKAKENAAKKKAEGDALTDAVYAVLTDEPALIADVAAKVEFEGATLSKVTYRLNQLVKMEKAVKSTISVAGGEGEKTRNLTAYARA